MANERSYFGLESDPREIPAYGVGEAAHYLRLPAATLASWVVGRPYPTRGGQKHWAPVIHLPDPNSRVLSFMNLVEAHVLSSIRRKHSLRFDAIRKALDYIEQHFPSRHPLTDRDFETDGKDLFIQEYGRIINVSQQGQQALREVMEQFLRRIDRDPKGLALRLYPFTRPQNEPEPKLVVIDPFVSFGRPVVSGTGIRTSVILHRFVAGDSADELAKDYGRPRAEIDEAIRWEKLSEAA